MFFGGEEKKEYFCEFYSNFWVHMSWMSAQNESDNVANIKQTTFFSDRYSQTKQMIMNFYYHNIRLWKMCSWFEYEKKVSHNVYGCARVYFDIIRIFILLLLYYFE